jgi:hypothetical protein
VGDPHDPRHAAQSVVQLAGALQAGFATFPCHRPPLHRPGVSERLLSPLVFALKPWAVEPIGTRHSVTQDEAKTRFAALRPPRP